MIKKDNIFLPKEASHIIETLNKNNYEAYFVGGCVRDSLIEKKPSDWDIATNANPSDIKALFKKTIDTGIKHNTITIVIDKKNFEVTTFRNSLCIEDDLGFRDFTINAIAYHPKKGFIDPFRGISDIKNSIIRCVGNASDRFVEDPLRLLRAVRLSSTLNFQIDNDTFNSIKGNCNAINTVSAERIREELTKILTSDNPMNFILLHQTGILKNILPEFDICFETAQNHPYHLYNVAVHSLHTVSHIENLNYLRWTMLLHDTGKCVTKTTDQKGIDHFYGHGEQSVNISKKVLLRLKFDNNTINKVCTLVKHHDRMIQPSYKSIRKVINTIGEEMFLDLLKVQEADKKGQNPAFLHDTLDKFNKIIEIYHDIMEKNHCLKLQDLAIDGNDLIKLGYTQGKEIGVILNNLLNSVIENPQLNKKETLLKILSTKFPH